MAKHTFGEYAAFTTKNQIRFQKNNRLVSENSVPPEVVAFLRKKLEPTLLPKEEKPLFKQPEPTIIEVAEAQETLGKHNEQQTDPLAIAMPTDTGSNLPPEPFEDEMTDFMDAVSIHTATLEDIANALYERFGIYSVYLRKMPAADEINPLTGEQFTKYHLGIAYQAAIRAQHSGVFRRAPEQARVAIDANRAAAQDHRAAFVPLPTTLGEAKKQDSFAYRTSVRGSSGYGQQSSQGELVNVRGEDGEVRSARLDVDPNVGSPSGMVSVQPDGRFDLDEPLAEPPFRGKKIIRPNW